MQLSTMLLASALIAAPATLAGSHAMDDGSLFGHCTAYENREEGRAHGNASQAPPFQALEENASAENETVAEHCEDVQPPGEEHRPDDAGHAADEDREAAEDRGRADEHRPDDPGRADEEHGRADEGHGPP